MSEQRFENIEQRLTSVEGKADTLETKLERLEAKVDGLRVEMHTLHDDLGRQMRVLHEEVIDRIAALSPDYTQIRREFTTADAQLRDDVDRRLVPLEAMERQRQRRKPH